MKRCRFVHVGDLERCSSAVPGWPVLRGLQTGVVDIFSADCFASADHARWQVLHFAFESVECMCNYSWSKGVAIRKLDVATSALYHSRVLWQLC